MRPNHEKIPTLLGGPRMASPPLPLPPELPGPGEDIPPPEVPIPTDPAPTPERPPQA
jgi:hypothetical protein